MIQESNLAAAKLAQIFGSELLKVQEGSRTDSGNVPQVVKMNPKDFLQSTSGNSFKQPSSFDKQKQDQMIRHLQQQAEAAFPITEQPQLGAVPPTQVAAFVPQPAPSVQSVGPVSNTNVWDKISSSLERIANNLENINFTATKAKKRKVKPATL